MKTSLKMKTLALIIGSTMTAGAYAVDASTDNTINQNQNDSGQTTNMNSGSDSSNNPNMQNTETTMQNQGAQPAVTDDEIASALQTALSQYSGKVQVKVENNVVHLSGELPSDTDYEKVITVAESMKGVQNVNVDELTVKDSNAPLQDTYITAKVKGSLIQADIMGKELPSWTVDVETKNGTVYLSGSVASQDDIDKVLQVVKQVDGVQNVDNQLVVGNDDQNSDTVAGQNDDDNQTMNTNDGSMSTDNQDTSSDDPSADASTMSTGDGDTADSNTMTQ